MFMHMPKKLGIPVMIVVAACLAAYWWFVVAPVRVGDWTIYQGTGKEVYEEGTEPLVEILYSVRNPGKPLFSCTPWHGVHGAEEGWLHVVYSSEWPTTLRIMVEEKDGTAYEAQLVLTAGEGMLHPYLTEEQFSRVHPAKRAGDKPHPDFRQLRPKVTFYDGSGVRQPSTRFSNRIYFEVVVIDTK
jgi:hypothetical protein